MNEYKIPRIIQTKIMKNQKNMTIKQDGRKFQQYFCAVIASIGAVIGGNLLAWTSPNLRFLSTNNHSAPFISQNKIEGDMIAALTPFGAIFGTLPAAILANLWGRKLTMIIFSVPWIFSWILTTLACNVYVLYVARFIGGLVFGIFCGVLPMYFNEIAEDSTRGSLGTLFQLSVTLGQLLVFILGALDSYLILCNCLTVVSVALFCGLFAIPESPTFLVKKNRFVDAEKALRRLRGINYDISVEIQEIRGRIQSPDQRSLSLSKAKIKALIICIGLMLIQQFSGVNAVIFFSDTIFEHAGASSPTICAIIIGITQSTATFVSGALVDRTGRKILLLISAASMGLCLVVLGYYFWMHDHAMDTSNIKWVPLCTLVCFFIGFSLGFGPVPWVMAVEVLDPEIKSFGATIAAATNLMGVTLITFFFQPVTELIGTGYTFWMFSAVCALSTVFVLLVLPETKGKSIEEVQDILAGRKSKNVNDRSSS